MAIIETRTVLETLLSPRTGGKRLQYVVMGGNAGDALIDLGFFTLARNHHIPYDITPVESVTGDRPVVISGGGGLVTEWGNEGTRAVIEALHAHSELLVVLPSTVRANEDLLGRLGTNVVFFAREAQSFAHLQRHATGGASILIDHDMAFNLDARNLLNTGKPTLPKLNNMKDVVRLGLYGIARTRGLLRNSIEVHRRDVERLSTQRPWRLYNDLSFVAAFRGKDRQTITNTGKLLLAAVDEYQTVRTDRLHVGIAAYLLDKDVVFENNSNSKIRGVYEFSLAGAPNVRYAS